MTKLYPTKNELPENVRKQMIVLLNANLASGIHLGIQAKQAHWNVKGTTFIQLHELFDSVYSEITGWVDLLAERAVQLGGIAEGDLENVSAHSVLPKYDQTLSNGRDHVAALSGSLAAFGKSIRQAIEVADKANDAGSADLFTEVSRGSDKMLWFLEAHLQT